jgi:hypothetical protein
MAKCLVLVREKIYRTHIELDNSHTQEKDVMKHCSSRNLRRRGPGRIESQAQPSSVVVEGLKPAVRG